jgi:transketolase N-terminal domain/subunit
MPPQPDMLSLEEHAVNKSNRRAANDTQALIAGVGHALSALSIALIESGAVKAEVLAAAAGPGARIEGLEGLFCQIIRATAANPLKDPDPMPPGSPL